MLPLPFFGKNSCCCCSPAFSGQSIYSLTMGSQSGVLCFSRFAPAQNWVKKLLCIYQIISHRGFKTSMLLMAKTSHCRRKCHPPNPSALNGCTGPAWSWSQSLLLAVRGEGGRRGLMSGCLPLPPAPAPRLPHLP